MVHVRVKGQIVAEYLQRAIRYRNYAEELRLIAADRSVEENRDTLLRVAGDYDRIASSLEEMSKAAALISSGPANRSRG